MACDWPGSPARAHLPGPHLRLSDERPRFRAAGGPAGGGRLPAGGRGRRRRRGGLQHLRRPGERRQQAVRQPQPPGPAQARQSRHADRGRRLPGPKGPRRGAAQGAVGRRRFRHAQHRIAAHAARPGPAQQGRPGRNRRSAAAVPVVAAERPRIRLCRLGFHLRRMQQQLHVLHRAVAARQGGRPQSRPTSWPRCNRWSTTACSKSPCWARTSTPTGSPSPTPRCRAIAAPSPSCCGPADASTGWNACGSPRRIRPSSPTTSSRRWRRRPMSAPPCTCRCSPDPTGCCARCGGPTVPSAISASSTGFGRRCRTPPSRPI